MCSTTHGHMFQNQCLTPMPVCYATGPPLSAYCLCYTFQGLPYLWWFGIWGNIAWSLAMLYSQFCGLGVSGFPSVLVTREPTYLFLLYCIFIPYYLSLRYSQCPHKHISFCCSVMCNCQHIPCVGTKTNRGSWEAVLKENICRMKSGCVNADLNIYHFIVL